MSFVSSLKQIKNKLIAPSNNAFIHNKFILYFIFFLSLADLLILTVEKDYVSVSIFILVGILVTYFSKNMLIILFIALTFTNIIKYGTKIRSEGFEPADENDVKDISDKHSEDFLVSKDKDEDRKHDEKDEKKHDEKDEKKHDKKEEKKHDEKKHHEKKDDEIKSDKYKENEIKSEKKESAFSKEDTLTVDDAKALFGKMSNLISSLK